MQSVPARSTLSREEGRMNLLADPAKKMGFILLLICLIIMTGCRRLMTLPEDWIPESAESSTALILSGDREEGTSEKGRTEKRTVGTDRQDELIYVHVCGCVKNPGVYALPAGARAQDAVDAAGGFTRKADSTAWNLASLLEDGMQVNIPGKNVEAAGKTGEEEPSSGSGAETATEGRLVNINTASAQDLTELPGIGESRAQDIVNYREENGLFGAIEDIKNVSGIGEGIYNKIKDLITV